LTMEEALILIEKRKEYDKTKKSKKRKSKWVTKKR
jgi:DNA topoisomerase-1